MPLYTCQMLDTTPVFNILLPFPATGTKLGRIVRFGVCLVRTPVLTVTVPLRFFPFSEYVLGEFGGSAFVPFVEHPHMPHPPPFWVQRFFLYVFFLVFSIRAIYRFVRLKKTF